MLLTAACSADTPILAATTTTSTQPPNPVSQPPAASQPPTTTVSLIDPGAFGIWTLDTDNPSAAWLNLPKHETLKVEISQLSGPFASMALEVTLGCNGTGGALYELVPAVKTSGRVSTLVSCGDLVDQAEQHLSELVFQATAVRLNDDEMTFGDPPEQLILQRSPGAPGTPAITDPAVYGKWEIAWDDPGILINLPDDTTLTVTVTEAQPGSDGSVDLEITIGCQVWNADTLAAHPLSEPLPDQMRADCGPLATAEQGVAFTILMSNWPLSIDGRDLVFGAPPIGFYMHPAN